MFGHNPSEYDLKVELASCCNGIGTVYLARHKPSGEYVSVKKYKMDKAREVNNLITVRHTFEIVFFTAIFF